MHMTRLLTLYCRHCMNASIALPLCSEVSEIVVVAINAAMAKKLCYQGQLRILKI